MSRLAVVLAVAALAGCGGGSDEPAAPSQAERDVRALVARMLELHPGLAAGTEARAALQRRGEELASRAGSLRRDQLVAEVMRLTTLGEYSFDVAVNAWFATTDWAEFEVIRQDLLLAILDIIERAGTSVAVPMRALRIEGDGDRTDAAIRSRDGHAMRRVDEPAVTPTIADR